MIIFITGTNKGLGLEFTKQYLERGENVIATCRNPKNASKLHELKKIFADKLSILKLEVRDNEEKGEVYEQVKNKFGKIDILINNAGIRSGGDADSYTIGNLYKEDLGKVFEVNSIAPVLISETFLDLVEKGDNPKIINITSALGSIGRKSFVFRYSYCASKSALNMLSKLMSIELKDKGIIVIPLHPGHVRTDLRGYQAPLVPKQSISGMIKVIDSLKLEDSGRYLSWDGTEIPW